MLDCEEKEEKKCYGLDIPVKGKPKWIYENPYRYVEKQGCKPVNDYFGFQGFDEDEGIALRNPLFIFEMDDIDYNMMFYSPNGERRWDSKATIKNKLASAFCNAYFSGLPPYVEEFQKECVEAGLILLPKRDRFFTREGKTQLKNYLKDLDWFM